MTKNNYSKNGKKPILLLLLSFILFNISYSSNLYLFNKIDYNKAELNSKKVYNIEIRPYTYKYDDITIKGYKYIDMDTNKEAVLILKQNENITFNIKNSSDYEITNVHWHGLKVPNKEDGPMIKIKKGETYTYNFTPKNTGTYWYHSHARSVRDQVDDGMYAPLIILDENEKVYNQDLFFMLDDIGGKVSEINSRNNKMSSGHMMSNGHMMEIIGKIKTINGVESKKLPPIEVIKGEKLKLRFINVSTAENQRLSVSKHNFTVTHLDGVQLEKPYTSKEIELTPGQRVEVELVADSADDIIKNTTGSYIKIQYKKGEVKTPKSPGLSNVKASLIKADEFTPDRTIVLDSKMDHSKESMTAWMIDGKEFPNVEPIKVKKGQVFKLRIKNQDTKNMHKMDHPIHLHGEHFQIISINGEIQKQAVFRDTVNVPAGGYVDIAFKIEEKGIWMLHCHILDHEDNGMMMTVNVI